MMKIQLKWQDEILAADLAKPISIAIPLKNGAENPNCYFAEPVKFEVIKGDGFIGSVKLGGSVNHQKISLSPHGNGTHTECYAHIADTTATIATQLDNHFQIAQIVSVQPLAMGGDLAIDRLVLQNTPLIADVKALITRTLPNTTEKLTRNYSGANPPYFTQDAMQLIVDHGIEHLVTDLPSVDKEQDEGRLSAHKTFWQVENEIRQNTTITELAFIPNFVADGLYLLDLQILPLDLDVSPSNPILYSLNPITE
jgi:kynurenine formamidase